MKPDTFGGESSAEQPLSEQLKRPNGWRTPAQACIAAAGTARDIYRGMVEETRHVQQRALIDGQLTRSPFEVAAKIAQCMGFGVDPLMEVDTILLALRPVLLSNERQRLLVIVGRSEQLDREAVQMLCRLALDGCLRLALIGEPKLELLLPPANSDVLTVHHLAPAQDLAVETGNKFNKSSMLERLSQAKSMQIALFGVIAVTAAWWFGTSGSEKVVVDTPSSLEPIDAPQSTVPGVAILAPLPEPRQKAVVEADSDTGNLELVEATGVVQEPANPITFEGSADHSVSVAPETTDAVVSESMRIERDVYQRGRAWLEAAAPEQYTLQLGAFSSEQVVRRAAEQLESVDLRWLKAVNKEPVLYVLFSGDFANHDDAKRAAEGLPAPWGDQARIRSIKLLQSAYVQGSR